MADESYTIVPQGFKEADETLTRIAPQLVEQELLKTNKAVAPLVDRVIKRYSPISPTKSQYQMQLKGKANSRGKIIRRSMRTDFNPGGLIRSIQYQAAYNYIHFFIPRNSEAGDYAEWVHNAMHGNGIGTRLKGTQAGRLFMIRGILDSENVTNEKYRATVNRIVTRLNN
jgi:hypothetical protein